MIYICSLTDIDVQQACTHLRKEYKSARAVIYDSKTERSSYKNVTDTNYDSIVNDESSIAIEFTSDAIYEDSIIVDLCNNLVAIDISDTNEVQKAIHDLHLNITRKIG